MVQDALLAVITEAVSACGHSLYACFHNQDNGGTLHILIDDSQGLTLAECITISEQIDEALLQHDINRDNFHIEVASPGIDRPLLTMQHYQAAIGKTIQVKLDEPIDETRQRQFTGKLIQANDTSVELAIEKDFSRSFQYGNITGARIRDLGKTGGKK